MTFKCEKTYGLSWAAAWFINPVKRRMVAVAVPSLLERFAFAATIPETIGRMDDFCVFKYLQVMVG